MLYLLAAVVLLSIYMALRLSGRTASRREILLMSAQEDDSDIKIAGQEPRSLPEDEAKHEAEQLARYRETGKVEKARALGIALARLVMAEDIGAYCGGTVAGRIHLHCRLILSCAVQGTWKTLPKVLADVVYGAFSETLEQEYPNFYKQMVNSGALSFYTLGLRSQGDPAQEVGCTFARLTDRDGDAAAAADGARLYRTFLEKADRQLGASGLKS